MDLIIDLVNLAVLLVLFAMDAWTIFYLFTKCLSGLIHNLAGENRASAVKQRAIVTASTCLSFLLLLLLFCDLSNAPSMFIVIACGVVGVMLAYAVVGRLNSRCKHEQDCVDDFARVCSQIENRGIASSSARKEFETRLAGQARGLSRIELDTLLQKILEGCRRHVDRADSKRDKMNTHFSLGVSMCFLIVAVWNIACGGDARSLTITSGDAWPFIGLTIFFFMMIFIIEIYRKIETLDDENGARVQTHLLVETIEEMQFKLLLTK